MSLRFFLIALFCFTPVASRAESPTVALVGATIYPSPTSAAISNGVVLISDGKIQQVGPKNKVRIPRGTKTIDCADLFLVAGFQNSHVHFTEPKWENAAHLPPDQLSQQLDAMFLRYGFTTVVDTGSMLPNTVALRERITRSEVRGPRIYTAGGPLYPENGIPFYLRESLAPAILLILHTPRDPAEASAIARKQLDAGADIVKLFTGSWVQRGRVMPMKSEIAQAAAAEAHQRKKLVFSHASSVVGLDVALKSGVDVIAHALDDDRGLTPAHLQRMKDANMALIPTLKLFSGQPYTKFIQQQVGDYARLGGDILFGTDVGYIPDYDTTQEYELMAGAGFDWKQILASLTTTPAARFGESAKRGRIERGLDADLVLLSADPAKDTRAFTAVRYTIRAGRILYESPKP